MTISIVIPVFNRKKSIDRCLKSVLAQSYSDIEVIIVDDGSNDGTAEICDAYSECNTNVKVVHVDNGGASRARNIGIDKSSGEYVMFVDSDDYIAPNICETFADIIRFEPVDIIIGDYCIDIDGDYYPVRLSKCIENQPINGMEYLYTSIKNKMFQAAVWGNIYKRELFSNENRFREELRYHEDMDLTLRLMVKARQLKFCDKTGYFYCINKDSVMSTANCLRRHRDMMRTLERWRDEANKCQEERIKNILQCQISKCFINSNIYNLIYLPDFSVFSRTYIAVNELDVKEHIKAILFICAPYLLVVIYKIYCSFFNRGVRHLNLRKWSNE